MRISRVLYDEAADIMPLPAVYIATAVCIIVAIVMLIIK
jgi:hypothetical protein